MLRLTQSTYQRQALTKTQRQTLRLALRLSQELKHPDIPSATRGYEGMVVADEMLKERNSVGLLVGGIAQKVWNQRTKPEQLAAKKDVDVVVLSDDFELKKHFEGGIDWWLPREERISAYSSHGLLQTEKNQRWWQNGYDCVLNWGFKDQYKDLISVPDLDPGLYIPARDDVVTMRIYYALSFVDDGMELDDILEGRFSKEVGTRLPRFVRDGFAGQILDGYYENDCKKTGRFIPEEIDRDILLKIKSMSRD